MKWQKWRVRCTTDSKDEFVILEEGQGPPTKCPTADAHTIDAAAGGIQEELDETTVTVREEPVETPTGGHFVEASLVFTTETPATIKNYDFTSPVPFAMLSAALLCKGMTDGDRIGFDIAPNSVVGVLDVAAASGVAVVTVPQSVIDLFGTKDMWLGQLLHLSDGTTTDDLGLIQSYDVSAKTITASINTSQAWPITSTQIQVTTSMTPPLFDSMQAQGWLELDAGDKEIAFGISKIGASHILASKIIRIRYDDKGAGGAKVKARLEGLI